MEYPKINTLWKREGCGEFDEKAGRYKADLEKRPRKSPIMEGLYSDPAFHCVKYWLVEEKVDGTNIRIIFTRDEKGVPSLTFGGRTGNAQIPTFLLQCLMKTFTIEKLDEKFKDSNFVVLFGEGVGPKIQVGQNFKKEYGFILFDAFVSGWWLLKSNLDDLAKSFGLERPYYFGQCDIEEVVNLVKVKPSSFMSEQVIPMEGVIARAPEGIMNRKGTPLIFKLKLDDYK